MDVPFNHSHAIGEGVRAAAAACGLDPALFEPAVRPADPRFGDFQANGVLAYAQRQRINPRACAAEVMAALVQTLDPAWYRWELAGPGFINFRLTAACQLAWLRHYGSESALRGGAGSRLSGQTVVVDYSSPNTAKEMHVGHIRSTVIGESLARMLAFSGATVIRDNHIGDWGTQFGMLIWAIKEAGYQVDAAPPERVIAELEALYQKGHAAYKESAATADCIRAELVKLQSGDAENTAIWKAITRVSWQAFDAIYQQLGIRFDVVLGESFYRDRVDAVCAELEALGIASVDAGALVVFHPEHKRFATQPFIIRKADGASNYGTTDLATILYRVEHFKADQLLYVVDARQSDHFEQLFLTARKWLAASGRPQPRMEHVSFGSVLGQNGKPIKTKEGGSVKLKEVMAEAVRRAEELVAVKSPELDALEAARVARAVGLGGIRYADLAQNRTQDYEFSWERMLSFEGNTAPYLLYAGARIHSIFRKAGVDLQAGFAAADQWATAEESALARKLLAFPTALELALADLRPHVLCTYLFELAGQFSSFYNANKVIVDEAPVRERRLLLCQRTLVILETGLHLLGLETLERM